MKIEFLVATNFINNTGGSNNRCLVISGASNSVSGTPVVCKFDGAKTVIIENFDTLVTPLKIEYFAQM